MWLKKNHFNIYIFLEYQQFSSAVLRWSEGFGTFTQRAAKWSDFTLTKGRITATRRLQHCYSSVYKTLQHLLQKDVFRGCYWSRDTIILYGCIPLECKWILLHCSLNLAEDTSPNKRFSLSSLIPPHNSMLTTLRNYLNWFTVSPLVWVRKLS